MIINLDYSEWWAERLVRSNKGWVGSITYTERDLCTFLVLADVWSCEAACCAGRASGAVGLSPGVALQKASNSVTPDNNCSISNVIQHSFQKSKPFVSDTCQWLLSVFSVVSHTHSSMFDFSVIFWTWLDFLGVSYNFPFGALLLSLSALASLRAWLFKQIW